MILENQEQNKFNKPSILINLSHSLDVGVNELKSFNYIIRRFLKENVKTEINNNIEKVSVRSNKIKTSYTEIAHNIFDRKDYKVSSTEINKYLNVLKDTSVIFRNWELNRNNWYDEVNSNLIAAYRYDTRFSDDLEIEISNMLLEFILEHRATFAKLDLVEIKNIKSRHSLKLYEVFKDYSHQFNLKLTLTQVRELLNIEEGKYLDTPTFNRDIIKKSINEINKKTYLDIEYVYKRATKKNEAYYLFTIRDINRYSFNLFKEAMIVYCTQHNMNVSFSTKSAKYYLESVEAKDKKNMNILFVNCSNGKTLEREKAIELWETLFHQSNYDTLNFFEKLNGDIQTFQTIYDVLKDRKNQTAKTKKLDDETEIIIHENQSTIEDFLY